MTTTAQPGRELRARQGTPHWRCPLDEAPDLFRQFAELWDADDEALRLFVCQWGLPDGGAAADLARLHERISRIAFLTATLDNLGPVKTRLFLAIDYRPHMTRHFNTGAGPPVFDLPVTLYGAMLSQIAEAGWRRCAQCGELFPLGDPEAKRGGRHSRQNSQFCSSSCKDRWHAAKRSENRRRALHGSLPAR